MKVIGVTEAAAIIGTTRSWIYENLRRIPHFRLSPRQIRFHKERVQAWADAGCPALDSWEYRPEQRPEKMFAM